MANKLCLDILDSPFTIDTDADEDYLQKVLEQFKAAISSTQNISGIQKPLNVAILTGFLLCDEVNKLNQEIEVLKTPQPEDTSISDQQIWEEQEVDDRTNRLITKLEHALSLYGYDKNL